MIIPADQMKAPSRIHSNAIIALQLSAFLQLARNGPAIAKESITHWSHATGLTPSLFGSRMH